MIKTKYILLVFIPAIIIAGLALFFNIIRYQPLYPKIKQVGKENSQLPIDMEKDIVIGNPNALKTIIAFEDFACDSCRKQFTLLEKLMTKYPDQIKIIWKGLPISDYPHSSLNAHKYSYCINQQKKFLNFYPLAFTNAKNLSNEILSLIAKKVEINEKKLNSCLQSQEVENYINQTTNLANLLNIQVVPTFFINNKQTKTPTSITEWEKILNL